jgi:hypothetical protein
VVAGRAATLRPLVQAHLDGVPNAIRSIADSGSGRMTRTEYKLKVPCCSARCVGGDPQTTRHTQHADAVARTAGQILPTLYFLGRTVLQLLSPALLLLVLALALASTGDVGLVGEVPPAAATVPLPPGPPATLLALPVAFYRPLLALLAWWCNAAWTLVATGTLLTTALGQGAHADLIRSTRTR